MGCMIEKSCQMPRQEKISEREAIKRQVEQAQNTQDRVKKAIQVAAQKHEKKAGRGDRAFRRGRIDKLTGNSRRERSEKTKRRQCLQDKKQWDAAKTSLEMCNDRCACELHTKADTEVGFRYWDCFVEGDMV